MSRTIGTVGLLLDLGRFPVSDYAAEIIRAGITTALVEAKERGELPGVVGFVVDDMHQVADRREQAR